MQLGITQFNAISLPGHLHLVKARLSTHLYHVISISETWLYAQISDDLVNLDDYFLVRNYRKGKRGDGVACYIHKSLRVMILAASPGPFSNAPEYLILELKCANSETSMYYVSMFTSMYGRPKGLLFNDFFNVLPRFTFAYKNIILGGDLDCNLMHSNFAATLLREMVL